MMRFFPCPVLLVFFLALGCAHSPGPAASAAPLQARPVPAASEPAQSPPSPAARTAPSEVRVTDDYGDIDVSEQAGEEAKAEIADPLEPFNRAMYQFNDKLYFWLLKPVAQGYGNVVPETARVSVGNFFTNLAFPIRFVNSLLQGNFEGAATELGRFTINTLWGAAGFLDPASNKEIDLAKQDADFGQTLGTYGLGQGFFINWPLLGPSSPRDTVGLVGDAFLTPTAYLTPWYAGAGARTYDRVNDTSLRIGDYESLKEAAIDPYVAIRDAYVQYRLKKISRKGGSAAAENTGSPKK